MTLHLRYEGVSPVLIVEWVEPTRDFFRDRLGFVQTVEMEHRGRLDFVILEKDAVRVMVQSHASVIEEVGHDAAREVNEAISGRGAAILYVQVSNVDLVVPAVADAEVIVPLHRTSYGMHEITVREPGGHAITFASKLAK